MKFFRFLFAALCVLVSSYTYAKDPHWVFTYEEAGVRTGTAHYMIKISDDGTFSVSATSLPITKNGLTKHQFSTKLDKAEIERIVNLAMDAHDFITGQDDLMPDGMWAEMMVIRGREKVMRRSGYINEWSGHPQSQSLVNRVKSHLPKELLDLPS